MLSTRPPGQRKVHIAAVVLAAGASKRFGSDKRLHPIDGTPMLARALAAYRAVLDDVGVVVRPRQPVVAALVEAAACRLIEAADAEQGQARSLAAGVAAMRHADGLLIGLGDMPFLAHSTLHALVSTMRRQPRRIVRPTHQGRAGNPVGFPSSCFDALTRLTGDVGARDMIAKSEQVLLCSTDDPNVLRDVDLPARARA